MYHRDVVFEILLSVSVDEALEECRRRGLVERELGRLHGIRHSRVRMPGRRGKLELSEWDGRAWLKVPVETEGKWASTVAWELAHLAPAPLS